VASADSGLERGARGQGAVDPWSVLESESFADPTIEDPAGSVGSGVGPATSAVWADFETDDPPGLRNLD
jgi:hypothetical protein